MKKGVFFLLCVLLYGGRAIAVESGLTAVEWQEQLNKAFAEDSELLQHSVGSSEEALLNLRLAKEFFYFREYPWAILYAERVQKLLPHNREAVHIAQEARSLLALPATLWEKSTIYLSLPERFQLFFYGALLLFVFLSIYLWYPLRLLRSLSWGLAFCVTFLLGSIGYERYVAPLEAVVIAPTLLYRHAGEMTMAVSQDPLDAGSQVRVLEVIQEGKWLKVLTSSDQLGYLPQYVVRVI
jgi:hypothetical protein